MPDGAAGGPDRGRPWWASDDDVGRAGPGPWQERDEGGRSTREDAVREALADARARDWLAEGADLFGQVAREAALRVGVGAPEGGLLDDALAAGRAAAAGRGRRAASGGGTSAGTEASDTHRIDTCGVCPLCSVIRVVAEARPEVVEHVAEATRHLTLALRAAVDARAGGWSDRGVEHIDVD